MGGVFNGHPWTAGGTWAFKNEAPENVLNQGFAGKGFMHKDEIYCYKEPYRSRKHQRTRQPRHE